MAANELAADALLVHSAVLVPALAAYLKYGDRSELVAKSLGGIEATIAKIAAQIAGELDEHLRPLFQGQVVNIALELPAEYAERPADPLGSEAYRNALKEYTNANSSSLADLWMLRRVRDSWCFWARGLSWLVVATCGYEMLAAGYLSIGVRIVGQAPSGAILQGSFVPTGLLVLGVVGAAVMMLIRHDFIVKLKMRHDAP
jgi:hypothetical protein